MEQNGLALGDTAILVTSTQEQASAMGFDVAAPAGPTVTATLVGVIDGAADLQDGYTISLFPPALLELGDVGLSGAQSAVGLAPGATTDDLRAQLAGLPDGTSLEVSPIEWVPAVVRSSVRAQGQGVAVLALFATAAAVAMIGQVLGRHDQLPDGERIALRSLGMTRHQLIGDSLARAAVPTIAGAIGSVAIAVACSELFPRGFVTRIEPNPGTRFDPLVHLLGPIVVAAAILGWVAIGLAAADRERLPRANPPLVEAIARNIRPVRPATGFRFAFSGARDRRWPTGSFVGLVAVLAVVIGGLTLGTDLGQLVDQPARYGSATYGVGSGGDQLPDAARTVLDTDADVAALTYYRTITVAAGTVSLDVTGMEPQRGELLPDVLTGRLPQSADEIVLGTLDARRLGVGVGDSLTVTTERGDTTLRVTGLAVIPGIDQNDGIGEGGIVTWPGLLRIDPSATASAAGFELRPGAPADTVTRLSGRMGMQVGATTGPAQIINIGRVRNIPFLVATTLALFLTLSLTHQLAVSARHRRRDVGILKALGADRSFVTEVVHVQATVFTAVVVAVAVPIGIIGGQSVFRLFTKSIGARGVAPVPIALLASCVLALLVLANLVASIPARRARRLDPAVQLMEE